MSLPFREWADCGTSEEDLANAAIPALGLCSVNRSLDMLGIGVVESESPSRLLNNACWRGVTEPEMVGFATRANGVANSGMSYMVSSSAAGASCLSGTEDGFDRERTASMVCSVAGEDWPLVMIGFATLESAGNLVRLGFCFVGSSGFAAMRGAGCEKGLSDPRPGATFSSFFWYFLLR